MVFRLSALYQIYSPPQLVQSKIIVAVVVQSLNCAQLFVTHELHHTRLICASLSPRVCSNSCLLSHWYYLTISFSGTLFFCLQSFSASESFPVSQLFASSGQSIGGSESVLPMKIQGWFTTDWFDLLAVQGTLRSLLQHHNSKASLLWWLAFNWSSSYICIWLLEKP